MTGRELPPGGFAGDTGAPDDDLDAALAAHARGQVDAGAVVEALAGARVLVPVVAVESAGAEHGADMALVTLAAPDGRRVLPVFTATERLAAWSDHARPVPVDVRRAALSAVDEGCELLALDPAGPVRLMVRRPALWALAQQQPWVPSWRHPQVLAALTALVEDLPVVERLAIADGGDRVELVVSLAVAADAPPDEVRAATAAVADLLGGQEDLRAAIDSVRVRVVPA